MPIIQDRGIYVKEKMDIDSNNIFIDNMFVFPISMDHTETKSITWGLHRLKLIFFTEYLDLIYEHSHGTIISCTCLSAM